MRHTTREIMVNGAVYPMNTPESELEGLTLGEAISLSSMGYLVDPNAVEGVPTAEPENVNASDKPNASTDALKSDAQTPSGDAPKSDAAAPPQPAAKASRPPRKRK